MTSQAVSCRIAALDAISRTRPLDAEESRQLELLITVENRYASAKRQQDAKRAARAVAA